MNIELIRKTTARMRRGAALGLALSCATSALAQPPTSEPATLDEVIVKGQLLRPEDSAFTSTSIDTQAIREQSPNDVDEVFKQVPGMAVRDFQLAGVASAIVIRGFGSGGHGGDLGAVVDGIPLNEAMSHADGYFDLNVLVPLEIADVTVYKGAVSALYGNFNRGGLVNIRTRSSGDYAQLDLAADTDSTGDLQAAYGAALGANQQVNLAGQYYRTDGFRPQSDSERATLAARWAVDFSPRVQLAISGRYHDSESDSASYLLLSQFLADRDGIDPRAQNDGAEREFATLRTDLNVALTDDLKLLTFAYSTQQDFTRWFSRPVNASTWRQREETYNRSVYGFGSSLNGRFPLAGSTALFTAGVEGFRESTEFEFYDGLNQRLRTAAAINDRDTRLNSLAAFAQVDAPLHRLAQISAGLRADRFTGGCRLLGAETGTDPCSRLNDANHVSPKFGIKSDVASWLQLRASWAEGFSLPNGFVKYSIGGQPLDETIFRQTEISVRVAAGSQFELDVAAYRIVSDGEVRTVAPGVFENFGATRRRGIEASAKWSPLERLSVTAAYGLADAEITQNADARLIGLRVPGVPLHSATLQIDFSPLPALKLTAGVRSQDDYLIDALNTLRAESYDIFDFGVSYRSSSRMRYRLYAKIDNLTDERYATTELVIGGQRMVAPGTPRTARVGVQFDF
jgi:iron complex outermembrane recepter protein